MTHTLFCPATMCPLFAADGSPWTGEKDTPCVGEECGWFYKGHCTAAEAASEGAAMSLPVLEPRTFDCPHARRCQWQAESDGLCPPRRVLAAGVHPHDCRWRT